MKERMRGLRLLKCCPYSGALLFGVLAVTVAGFFLAGCASARRGEPIAGEWKGDPKIERGKVVFMQKCHMCHPGGEAGLGPALNNKPAPPETTSA